MKIRNIITVLVGLCALAATSFGDPLAEHRPAPSSIEDLTTQLDGTSWRAVPAKPLRPGLAAMLTFTETTVAPAGYHYAVNARDSLTITFNHGDTQLMLLEPDGKRLKLLFHDHDYTYQLVAH